MRLRASMRGGSPAEWGCLKLKHSCSIWCFGTVLPVTKSTYALTYAVDSALCLLYNQWLFGFLQTVYVWVIR